jgi:ring-1,2-phenylacetyl-CoA epoxidase subunit PaaC
MKNDNSALFEYCLRLGDTSLILGQRLAEWCGHGPILEEDIALTNISLDLIGQARAFLAYAGTIEGKGRSEDDLAFLRDERQYRNALLAEQPNGDFGQTILREFFISAFQYFYYRELQKSTDTTLAPLAGKSLKEVTYHLRHSNEWLLRLGTGTKESHQRMVNAIDELWAYTGDLFEMTEQDQELVATGIAVDLAAIRPLWEQKVNEIFAQAGLKVPENVFMIGGSREGRHTEHLGHLLAEMQAIPRAFPGAEW